MRDATRVVRAGLPPAAPGQPFLPGPTFAGPFHAPGDPADSPFSYARDHNPTWSHFEAALAELEGGPCVVFPSGMAAVSAVMGETLRPGDTLLMVADGYYTVRELAADYLATMGIDVRMAPARDIAQMPLLDGMRLLWIETPTNPGLDVCDIAALAQAAHARDVLVAVDNTTPTSLGQSPLALGADFSVASDTKSLTGHDDLILGHVAARETSWAERLHTWRTHHGVVAGPMEVWLAHRSLATLALRLERQCANALAIARLLREHPQVVSVRYPGLDDDPAHPVAARQMRYYGPIVTFVLDGRARAERFLAGCELVTEATSFGGVHTTAERRGRWSGDAVPDGLIRLSAGCEDTSDLLADITQALAALPHA